MGADFFDGGLASLSTSPGLSFNEEQREHELVCFSVHEAHHVESAMTASLPQTFSIDLWYVECGKWASTCLRLFAACFSRKASARPCNRRFRLSFSEAVSIL